MQQTQAEDHIGHKYLLIKDALTNLYNDKKAAKNLHSLPLPIYIYFVATSASS